MLSIKIQISPASEPNAVKTMPNHRRKNQTPLKTNKYDMVEIPIPATHPNYATKLTQSQLISFGRDRLCREQSHPLDPHHRFKSTPLRAPTPPNLFRSATRAAPPHQPTHSIATNPLTRETHTYPLFSPHPAYTAKICVVLLSQIQQIDAVPRHTAANTYPMPLLKPPQIRRSRARYARTIKEPTPTANSSHPIRASKTRHPMAPTP